MVQCGPAEIKSCCMDNLCNRSKLGAVWTGFWTNNSTFYGWYSVVTVWLQCGRSVVQCGPVWCLGSPVLGNLSIVVPKVK